MTNRGQKNMHFQLPEGLFNSFYRMFPGQGERKAFLTKCVSEAIRLQRHKDNFVDLVIKGVIREGEEL